MLTGFLDRYNFCVLYVVELLPMVSGPCSGSIDHFIDVWIISLLSPLLILALNIFLDWYTMAFSVISFFFHVRTFFISTPYRNYDCWLNPLRDHAPLRSISQNLIFWDFGFFLIRHSARCGYARKSYRSEYAYYSNINEHIDWTELGPESLQGALTT